MKTKVKLNSKEMTKKLLYQDLEPGDWFTFAEQRSYSYDNDSVVRVRTGGGHIVFNSDCIDECLEDCFKGDAVTLLKDVEIKY